MTSSNSAAKAWLIVALLWGAAFLNYFPRIMITTMHGSIMSAIPMSETQFGLLTSVFLWTYGLTSPFAGYLADRFGRSRVIIISMLAWSILTYLTSYARNFDELLLTRVLMGISEATYLPASLALIADYHPGRTRSFATGLHITGIFVGSSFAGFGGYLGEQHGWSYPFTVIGLVSLGYGVLLLFTLRDLKRKEGPGASGEEIKPRATFGAALGSLLTRGSFVLLLCSYGIAGMVGWLVSGWMSVFFAEHYHLGAGAAGFSANGFYNIAGLFGLLVSGAWADQWARKNYRARLYVVVIGLCIAGPGILLTAQTTTYAFAALGLVLYGFASTFSDSNMMPILCHITDARYRATGYGVLNMAGTIAGGLAVYVAGALRDVHVNLSRVLSITSCGLGLCVILLLLIKLQQPAEPAASALD